MTKGDKGSARGSARVRGCESTGTQKGRAGAELGQQKGLPFDREPHCVVGALVFEQQA